MRVLAFFILAGSGLLAGCHNAAATPDTYRYSCDSGVRVTATYPDTDSARVTYLGREHSMRVDVSASGTRYVGDLLEWWTKGTEGTLLQRNASGDSNVLEHCKQQR